MPTSKLRVSVLFAKLTLTPMPQAVARAMLPALFSTSHSAPSDPVAIPVGKLLAVGRGYSVAMPEVVMRPTELKTPPVNHSSPSGPAAICPVAPSGDRTNDVTTPVVVMRPILSAGRDNSVNHKAPSGPVVIQLGEVRPLPRANSWIAPAVVMRPIWLPMLSVNHSAPSGPAAIPMG